MRKSGWACTFAFLEVIMENKNQEYLVKEKLSTLSPCETDAVTVKERHFKTVSDLIEVNERTCKPLRLARP